MRIRSESEKSDVSSRKVVPVVRLLLAVSALVIVQAGPVAGQETDDSPGLLSAAHAGLDEADGCENCHNDAGEVEGERCLVCHDLIGDRMAAKKGVHREATVDDCAVCHAEHQGRQASIVPLEPGSFDHSETGAELGGAHRFTKECGTCHTPANTLPRGQGRSYLFKVAGCRGCHKPPHPGRQENCLACHGHDTSSVDRRPSKG